jgi:hypothetical protein
MKESLLFTCLYILREETEREKISSSRNIFSS